MAVGVLIAFVYVQVRLPVHAATRAQATATRLLLAATGVGLGLIGAWMYQGVGGIVPWLAFLVGFGVAHVPAAFILFIKRERGEYR
ncbi:hypothetical protein CAI21_02530 [Alkalilimnicola ehrlichii]|uniref:Transmembrane protein n=2 Tax=Alkalilimnicola ehrlichii TaxID=351052 RepID=A0A3E0X3J3_9GAMM|nr:hypothetical protein CAI21_02530 [Alkalilimnicola ehrlichii]RFA39026.1 hypothetical protein CAL65_02680 [Alkalilimnicola ehrlichii]